MTLSRIAIEAELFILKLDKLITDSRVEDDGRIVIAIPVGYVDNDVDSGAYDKATSARLEKINTVIGDLGFRFSSSAAELGGESWTLIPLV